MPLKVAHSPMCVQAGENRPTDTVRNGLKKCDTKRWNAKSQGQSAGCGHRDSDSGETAWPDADADRVKIAPGDARFFEHLR